MVRPDLIRAIALEYPDCLVLLVGNDTAGARNVLADLPNVEFYWRGTVCHDTVLSARVRCLLVAVQGYSTHSGDEPSEGLTNTLPQASPWSASTCLKSASLAIWCHELILSGDFVAQVGVMLQESGITAERMSDERRHFASGADLESPWRGVGGGT